jgi:murein DD-endopeptidase MepM/ murein hydrolase activator NlpD
MEIKIDSTLKDFENPDQRDQKLKKACQEFESVFTYQLLKSMRATIDKSDLLHGGQGEDIYESMLDEELAKRIQDWGPNSLSYALYEQLKKVDTKDNQPATDLKGNQPLWPIKSGISSGFGWRKDPFNGETKFHYGIDLPAQAGTPVKASLPGKVLVSDHQEGYGNYVLVDHGQGITTLYAHNAKNTVQKGDRVQKGSVLGLVGVTGHTTGPHLHFEVRRNGQYLDPSEFLNAGKSLL